MMAGAPWKQSCPYKPQHVKPEFAGSVQLWLDSELGMKWRQGEFHTTVIRPLQVDKLIEQDVRRLSGGELQAVSIAICLGKEADLYLLDEPSAHLMQMLEWRQRRPSENHGSE